MGNFHNDTLLTYKYFIKKIQLNIKRCKFKNFKKFCTRVIIQKNFAKKNLHFIYLTK